MTRNKLATHKTIAEKHRAYNAAVLDGHNKTMAYCSNGTTIPLADVDVSNVEFIGGLWRVQDSFPYKIQNVRDKSFVLHEKLDYQEKNLFEFYRASIVTQHCYGYFMSPKHYIIAKYTTDHGTYWSYGTTIEQARAFLGIKLYDEYMDLIHSVACQKISRNQAK